jgi:hypothetical protein
MAETTIPAVIIPPDGQFTAQKKPLSGLPGIPPEASGLLKRR